MMTGTIIVARRLAVVRRPMLMPCSLAPTARDNIENITGWLRPWAPPRKAEAMNSSTRMPPRSGVIEMKNIDAAANSSRTQWGRMIFTIGPASNAPKLPANSEAAIRTPMRVPVSPIPSR